MNEMCGIEHLKCVALGVSPLQGLAATRVLTQGFTPGYHITPLQG